MERLTIAVGAVIAMVAGVSLGIGLIKGQSTLCLVAGGALLLSGVVMVGAMKKMRERRVQQVGKGYEELRETLLDQRPPSPRLGEILVNRYNLLTPHQLQLALNRQRSHPKLLGQVLVEMGFITQEQLRSILDEQESWRDFQRR